MHAVALTSASTPAALAASVMRETSRLLLNPPAQNNWIRTGVSLR